MLCDTRAEWRLRELRNLKRGGVVVPIYPTIFPRGVRVGGPKSQSRSVFAEDAGQVAKSSRSAIQLARILKAIVVLERRGRPTRSRSTPARARRGRDAAEVAGAPQAVGPEDPYTFIYTSGTTGPPKGCVLSPATTAPS